MSEQKLGELYRASMSVTGELDERSEAQLRAALLGGGSADERDAGLDLLARLPQGPALARAVLAMEPESRRLSAELVSRMAPPRRWRPVPMALAMAAGLGAVAVMVAGLGDLPGSTEGVPGGELASAEIDDGRILIASFEPANGDNGDAGSTNGDAGSEDGKIFRGSFGS